MTDAVSAKRASARPSARPRWWALPCPRAVASLLALLALLPGIAALPYLSERATSAVVNDASRGHLTQAVASARTASRLDLLAVYPLIMLALVQARQHQATAARSTLDKAVHLQPRNYSGYYQMGLPTLNWSDADARSPMCLIISESTLQARAGGRRC